MKNLRNTILALVGAIALLSSSANANTINVDFVGVVPNGGGGSDWTYQYSTTNSFLTAGESFFTIYDFGAAAVVVSPGTWTFSQLASGPVAPGVLVTDNPGILNATFTWSGATGFVGTTGPILFTLHSALGVTAVPVDWSSFDRDIGGTPSSGRGSVSAPNVVPDSGSAVALLGIALTGIEGVRRMIRARKA